MKDASGRRNRSAYEKIAARSNRSVHAPPGPDNSRVIPHSDGVPDFVPHLNMKP
jgi:hypothetical protein